MSTITAGPAISGTFVIVKADATKLPTDNAQSNHPHANGEGGKDGIDMLAVDEA